MPQVTVYVKKEDMERWKAVPDKADFIRRALHLEYQPFPKFDGKKFEQQPPRNFITKTDLNEPIKCASVRYCKHGNPKGSCLHKGATSLKCNVV